MVLQVFADAGQRMMQRHAGLRQNINVGIGYLEAWLRGVGCVPLHNLMEDAATAEISRAQVWQWIHHRQKLDDGRLVDLELCRKIIAEELAAAQATSGARYDAAAKLFDTLIAQDEFAEFLTLSAYDQLVAEGV